MSKVCTNCGYQNTDDTMFCVNCGGQLSAPAAEPAQKPAKKTGKKIDVEGLKKDPKKLGIIGAIAAVVVIVAIILAINLIPKPYEAALKNMADLSIGKSGAVTKLIPKELYEDLEKFSGIDKKEFKDDAKDYADELSKETKDTYGEKVKFTYDIVKAEKMPKKMVQKIADGLENNYGLDDSKVKAGYLVAITFEISGDESVAFTTNASQVEIVKIGGSWYVVEWNGAEGKTSTTTLVGLKEILTSDTFEKAAKVDPKSDFAKHDGLDFSIDMEDAYEDAYEMYEDYYGY